MLEQRFDDFQDDNQMKEMYLMMNSPYYLQTKSLSSLYDEVYKAKTPVIDNLLYSGTYLFVGAPKVGKSFFMAQLAYHISTGTDLWNYKVNQGTVLYLALEDDYARLQRRLYSMFGANGNDNLYLATHAQQLEFFISQHKDTKLIIIDTLQKIREVSGDKFSYANDYDVVTKLKRFSDNNNICMLLVHHTRKQQADDSFETISGTNGLLGAADGAFVLHKEKRTNAKALLDIVGRDQQDQRLHLEFNKSQLVWEFVKSETELWSVPDDPLLAKVAQIVNGEHTEWQGTATELINHLDLDIKPNALTRHLNVNADRLWREYNISYDCKRNRDSRQIIFNYSPPPLE